MHLLLHRKRGVKGLHNFRDIVSNLGKIYAVHNYSKNTMNSIEILDIGRLRCPMVKFLGNLFFSLVDYRNTLFTSDDPEKIIEFYNSFENRDQLIWWMKERPKGASYITEVEGDKEIIVVIPTADFNGKYAKEVRETIFKGLHMVFVESGEVPDPYFNYAHNCNVGVKKAMEYNPKWIVVSNDDMYKEDDISKLIAELSNLDNKACYSVFTPPSQYHSSPHRLAKPNFLFKIYYSKISKHNRENLRFLNKFSINFLICPESGLYSMLFRKGYSYLEIQDFGIYSSQWINRNNMLYDETFINAGEDTDLAIKLSFNSDRICKISYKIGDMIGSTIGVGVNRSLRTIAGLAYLNHKWSKKLTDMQLTQSTDLKIDLVRSYKKS